jgi:transcriptional regulator with XRE-family HTH domain
MDVFAKKLKERAEHMGISNAEAARVVGLDERRYAHYASGRREPDLATLVKIAKALTITPNWLLGLGVEGASQTRKSDLLDRLSSAGQGLPDADLKSLVVQAEALAAMNRKRK